jgi:hypothetical protein
MPIWQRLLIVFGVTAVFWPDITVEALGAVVVAGVLALNWLEGQVDLVVRVRRYFTR